MAVVVRNDTDIVICKLGGIFLAPNNIQGFIGTTGHYVLVICRGGTEAGIVAAKTDLPGQSIELGPVDSIGAGSADQAGGHVL